MILILVVSILLGTPRPVLATGTINVTTFVDEWEPNTSCSLREAIYAANWDIRFQGCSSGNGTDTIVLQSGMYDVSRKDATISEDVDRFGDLDIYSDVILSGQGSQGSSATQIVASHMGDRVFHVKATTPGGVRVTWLNLSISGGEMASGDGGGIYNDKGNLTLENVLVTGNTAGSSPGLGGGVFNSIGGALTISNSTISANTGSFGGGIFNYGTFSFKNSVLSGNSATRSGGGLDNRPHNSTDYTAISGSTISANHAADQIAGIASNWRLTITSSAIDSNEGIGIWAGGGSNLIISGARIVKNAGDGVVVKSGSTADINFTLIEQNAGAGLSVDSNVTATVTTTNVDANQADGIDSAGSLTIQRSTIAGNTGAGLKVSGGTAALTNSTVAANGGEGVETASTGELHLMNATLANNSAGGLWLEGGSSAYVRNTIIADNLISNCTNNGTVPLTSEGNNLLYHPALPSGGNCSFKIGNGDLEGDPKLASQLAYNGGFTKTYAILDSTSPAVDVIADTDPGSVCLTIDQRGATRPIDGDGDGGTGCDIGAFEYGAVFHFISLPIVQR
jgi:CSLREA domain-containing protein